VRWGLIGGSDIAATRMIPAMRAPGQPTCAVASSTPGAGRGVRRHPFHSRGRRRTSGSWWRREDVHAVYISTVTRLHGEHTLHAAAAGKHVLCEKPVAMDLTPAWSMVRACFGRRGDVRGE